MNNQTSPEQHTNKKLEAETLFKFKAPILIATFDGLKKVSIKGIKRFHLVTNLGVIKKHDIIFVMLYGSVKQMGDSARINKNVENMKMRTEIKRKERPKVLNTETLQTAVNTPVKTTMLSGHVFYGILVEYNRYNLLLTVNNQPVLIYRHAVHQFEIEQE